MLGKHTWSLNQANNAAASSCRFFITVIKLNTHKFKCPQDNAFRIPLGNKSYLHPKMPSWAYIFISLSSFLPIEINRETRNLIKGKNLLPCQKTRWVFSTSQNHGGRSMGCGTDGTGLRQRLAHSQFKISKETVHPESRQYRSLLDLFYPPTKKSNSSGSQGLEKKARCETLGKRQILTWCAMWGQQQV